MLPRESNSKETDAGLLSVISYPAFALNDIDLINLTRTDILTKLQGKYGCSRFIRDGYKTAKEDPSRLHYEPWELKVFENIECEWPLFWCYLVLDGIFYENNEQVETIASQLDSVLIKDDESIPLVPELYAVPAYKVEDEYKNPRSQQRVPLGKLPHMWAQSLYIVSKLLRDNLIAPGELDPLNKRLVVQPKPDLVVQVCVLAEDIEVQLKMQTNHNISIQTVSEVAPIIICPAKSLAHIYSFLGKNERLGLTGRPVTDIGFLATSKLYKMRGQLLAFTATLFDHKSFYLANDIEYSLDLFRTYVAFIEKNWNNMPGRPTVIFVITKDIYDAHEALDSQLISTIKKLYSGYINGARVQLGKLEDFIKTACLANLTFIGDDEEGEETERLIFDAMNKNSKVEDDIKRYKSRLSLTGTYKIGQNDGTSPLTGSMTNFAANANSHAHNSHHQKPSLDGIIGIAKRSRSIYTAECPMNASKRPSFSAIFIDAKRIRDLQHKAAVLRSSISIEENEDPEHSRLIGGKPAQVIFGSMDTDALLKLLKETKSLHVEADIIHYLYETKTLDWSLGNIYPGETLKNLIMRVYEKACMRKMWWLVRHSSGMINMKSDELSKAVLCIIVRQKQISIGIPTNVKDSEISIKSPLPTEQISALIKQAWKNDVSMMMVTQELLIYLGLFISTEPQLFEGMIRLRVGLIIQVMIGELERTLNCSAEESTDHFLNLSPFEMKTLLHMIISGKELGATPTYSMKPVSSDENKIEAERRYIKEELKLGNSMRHKPIYLNTMEESEEDTENTILNKHGQWIRRRRLDGSLNRVPIGFYSKVWMALERCQGIQIYSYVLNQSLTREMTKEELKFALLVEEALNRIPEPEYRQLIAEACMIMIMLAESEPNFHLNEIIVIDHIVERANDIFLNEQIKSNGDATLCCAIGNRCPGARQICEHFYDLAPSGRYGSMNYLFKALTQIIKIHEKPECNIQ
jgi:phosphorylase kinase alpha/beta subunit